MSMLKNGGWRGIGEFVQIRKTLTVGGKDVQVCSFTRQADQNGKRSRTYFELRTADKVVELSASVRSLRGAIARAHELAL